MAEQMLCATRPRFEAFLEFREFPPLNKVGGDGIGRNEIARKEGILMKPSVVLLKPGKCILFLAFLLVVCQTTSGQAPPPAWSFTKYFQFNIENVLVTTTAPGTWNVKVIFSVTNLNPDPGVPNETWNIKSDLPFQSTGGAVTIDLGWDSQEFTNTGGAPVVGTPSLVPRLTALDPVVTTSLGTGAALPIQIRNLVNPVVPPGANTCALAWRIVQACP